MKIRFEKKGEVVEIDFDNAFVSQLPDPLQPEEGGPEGLDLTEYSVVHVQAGRHGRKKAEKAADRIPHAIVLYQFEWHNGFGEGVILPDNFDPDEVKFFETEEQLRREARIYREQAAKKVREEIRDNMSGVRVKKPHVSKKAAEITPLQEAFCTDRNWVVRVNSLGEAKQAVRKKKSFWKEWNRRALAFLKEAGYEDRGRGSVSLSFGGKKDGVERAAIKLPDKSAGPRNLYLKLEKANEEWKAVGKTKAQDTHGLFMYW